jgi:2-oxoglutarate ferredoxin oxidoreductase subunit gamma
LRTEIRISGFGGQGVALAGLIIGKACALYEDLEAVMTQSYGPEARGGASSADVVVADRPIDYPFLEEADVLIALSQEAYTRFRPEAKRKALVIIDEGLVEPLEDDRVLSIPATQLAEELGRRIVANVVVLGFFTAYLDLLQADSMRRAIESSVRPRTVPLNLDAFETGYSFSAQKERMR